MAEDLTTEAVVSLKGVDELVVDEVLPEDKADDEPESEEDIAQKTNSLPWDSLFAAAEEMDLDNAIETAIKTLRNGKEIGKLSVIRTLADLLISDGEECIEKVFPLVQEVLAKENSNLDLHCEAAVVFKNIIKDKKLENRFCGLSEKILNYILENVDNQRENVTAAAWLETLSEIADSIPERMLRLRIVPLVVSQAEPTKRVQRRVISTRLLDKLCSIVSVDCVKKDLAPCAQMLCRDPSAAVRTSIAQRLSVIAESLKNSTDCVSLLLPCLIELCKDDDPGVREAILNTIAICLPYFTKDSRKNIVIPLLRKCTEQALFLKDTSLSVVAKQIGPWDVLGPSELKWFLDTYCRLVDISLGDNDKINALLVTSCRRLCAYNFPCFAMVYGKENFNEKLMPILEKFCTDADDEVRSTLASGFHEIVQLRPDEPSTKFNVALVGPFIELIRAGAPEVVQQMTGNMHKTLPPLYECIKNATSLKISRVQLDRILIGCNRLLRGSGSWRSHEAYLNNIACIRYLIPFHDLYVSFLPMLKQEVLTARALPCRIAAAQTLLLMMREFPMEKNRNTVIEFFINTIGNHESCQRRRLLLDIVPFLLQHFSREFFKQNFLDAVLKLAHDKISNIRLQVCRILPRIKQHLVFPDDEVLISNLERVVRERLTQEKNVFDRQLIQQYACELSRAETAKKESKENRQKLVEEKRLWTEVEPATVESPDKVEEISMQQQKTLERKSSGRKLTSELAAKSSKPPANVPRSVEATSAERPPTGWRTARPEKPKVAVVRPQPQIVITQRSPSPMPPKPEERKSKLPLSTAKYRSPSSTHTTASSTNNNNTIRSSTPIVTEPNLHKYRTMPSESTSRNLPSPTNGLSGLKRSATTSSMNINANIMSRSANSSTSSTQSLSGPHALMTSRSMSNFRRPYGLMKVQSSSAIERKPPSLSIRVVGMS